MHAALPLVPDVEASLVSADSARLERPRDQRPASADTSPQGPLTCLGVAGGSWKMRFGRPNLRHFSHPLPGPRTVPSPTVRGTLYVSFLESDHLYIDYLFRRILIFCKV